MTRLSLPVREQLVRFLINPWVELRSVQLTAEGVAKVFPASIGQIGLLTKGVTVNLSVTRIL